MTSENNNADCYLVKCGNVEILYDCGSQLNYGKEENRTKNFCKNIYKKIVTYCTDGVLDYLIVTHADSDHISNLIIEGGLFDCVTNSNWVKDYYCKYNTEESKVTNVFGEPAEPLKEISNIIDFDSYRVRYDSLYANRGQDSFLSSDEYLHYWKKRDNLLSKMKTKYCPASYLFSSVTGETYKTQYHNYYAVPNDYMECATNPSLNINLKTFMGTVKNEVTSEEYNFVDNTNGLNKIEVNGTPRYTFDISIGEGVKLRILYNWYYDSYRCIIGNNNWEYGDYNEKGTTSGGKRSFSQPHNNISVCSLIESQKSKLLLLGDLGTYGEEALLKYYDKTDVLSNINCFKASHHGSTSLRETSDGKKGASENSRNLFSRIMPSTSKLNIIITGVAQPCRDFFNKEADDGNGGSVNEVQFNQGLVNRLTGVAVLEKRLFNNIGGQNFDMYETQILYKCKNSADGFNNMPFYGDIHVSFTSLCEVKYTYHGEIETYIKKTSANDDPLYKFKTSYKSLADLEWTKKVGLVD